MLLAAQLENPGEKVKSTFKVTRRFSTKAMLRQVVAFVRYKCKALCPEKFDLITPYPMKVIYSCKGTSDGSLCAESCGSADAEKRKESDSSLDASLFDVNIRVNCVLVVNPVE